MSYRFVYPNGGAAAGPVTGYGIDPSTMPTRYGNGLAPTMYDNQRQRSYSPGSFSSDTESSEDYEYRGRVITRETRRPRDVVRAPTPPPIIERVVERAPTPEAPVMERVIIRPQAQEIVERVIEQPRTPPPRIIEKEMHEEAPPPIVRTRVIKVDRPLRSGFSQPGSPYGNPAVGLPSFSHGMMGNMTPYRAQSIVGSVGRPAAYHHPVHDTNPSFSSASSFEYVPPAQMTPAVAPQTMMMMPSTGQQPQPIGVMQHTSQPMTMMANPGVQQQQQQQQQPMMYRQFHQAMPHNFLLPGHHPGMSFGYRPMMQQQQQPVRFMPHGMQMIPAGAPMTANFPNQSAMINPMAQQLVY